MLKLVKNNVLRAARNFGIFHMVAGSGWRRQRLLILCYHGISLKDEHQWRGGGLYVTPAFFERRLEILAQLGYSVLPLNDAVRMLGEGTLPPKSVAITFDDGFYDFYKFAFPILRRFGFPAMLYQTTWYSDHPFPIFNLVLSYLFWRGSGLRLDGSLFEIEGVFDLASDGDRERAANTFLEFADRRSYTPAQKNQLAARIALELGVDYDEIMRLRMLALMTQREIAEITRGGVDVQLHTHRHRAPLDENLFKREIRENRQWLATATGDEPTHFCYPSGQYRREFLPWLRAEKVVSATTCETGLATPGCEPLLLPRLLDGMNLTELDFEGWLTGFSSFLPQRRLS